MASSTETADGYPFNLNLDLFRREVTGNKEAQRWFNRGLKWCYGFNHEEAIWCFKKAIQADSKCAMAYWGIAYALGPNWNKTWERYSAVDARESLREAYGNAQKAASLSESLTSVEKGLIKAIISRYPQPETPPDPLQARSWNTSYADAMKLVYDEFGGGRDDPNDPGDPDVVTLYVESLMTITPWAMWIVKTGERNPDARTVEAQKALQKALEKWKDHPGLCHLCIHLMEMSNKPESALEVPSKLRKLIPDAGHLVHMPTHIDILMGDYTRAIDSNAKAVVADENFASELKKRGMEALWYTTYRVHNCKVLIYAAMMSGQLQTALEYAKKIEEIVTPEILKKNDKFPMADLLEAYRNVRVHVLIRFGLWDCLLSLPFPEDKELFCVTTAHMHYGRAIVYAATGRVKEAEEEKEEFLEAKRRVPKTRYDHKNPSTVVLELAQDMLMGELLYRRGKLVVDDGKKEEDKFKIAIGEIMIKKAFAHLQAAVSKDDDLIYAEPWAWMVPARHAYAALLLEQNRAKEALELYFEDLGTVLGYEIGWPRARWHPKNVWACVGVQECKKKLAGSDKAPRLDEEVKVALAAADVDINVSCFCSRGVETETA